MASNTNEFNYLKYSNHVGADFEKKLKERVRSYFKDNNISRFANLDMKMKTLFMISLFFTPYFLVMTGVVTNLWLIFLCWGIIGLGMAGIGMGVIHDANHGSYSKKKWVNYVLGRFTNVVGAYAPTWKIQHNVLHHTYTNIEGHDEDVAPSEFFLRLTPNGKHYKHHRFQHIYAWFLYSLMTLIWVTTKDFAQLFRYKKMGLTESESFRSLLIELFLSKLVYYFYMIVLPILILDISWWVVLLMLVFLQLVSGLTLTMVFSLAHIVPEATFPTPIDSTIENNWSIHQLETTSNFGPKSKIMSWFIGGLNYQIEHHLFPNICHVHYKKLSVIVKQTAEEFGIPYNSEPTFLSALRSHAKMLKTLGQA